MKETTTYYLLKWSLRNILWQIYWE